MRQLNIVLFGAFQCEAQGQPVFLIQSQRAQELLAYLLLHRQRPHSREAVMSALWTDAPAEQCRKHLRQTLWKLHESAKQFFSPGLCGAEETALVLAESDRLQLNPALNIAVDVARFEEAGNALQTPNPAPEAVHRARAAIELYRGDLLDGWYSDWCLVERERLQNMYLSMLDRLVLECRRADDRPGAREYARRMLRVDPAHERAHQALIWLCLAEGDHAGAMRQFNQCREILKDELDVPPSDETVALIKHLRASPVSITSPAPAAAPKNHPNLYESVRALKKLQAAAIHLQTRIQRQIDDLERSIEG